MATDKSPKGKPEDTPRGKDTVTVVVNGAETTVAIKGNPALTEILATALEQTHNTGQPAENWEMRGPDDAPIPDLSIKFKKLGLSDDGRLFVSLRAGVGG